MNYWEKISSRWWEMLLISYIPFFIILAPLLFGGQIFLKSDLIDWAYPIYQFYQNSLESGQSILWNPNNFSGFPSFISSMGFFSPLHYVLFQILPIFAAYNLIIFLNTGLALFFIWRLMLKFKLSLLAGFIGGLVYVFAQWYWFYDITVCNALPILPLLFLFLYQIKEKQDNWSVFGAGLVIGWAWLSIHLNFLVMILSAGFLFSLFLTWLGSDLRKGLWLMMKYLVMVLIGTGIGLVILLPFLNYGSLSARAEGLTYTQVSNGAFGLGDLVRFVLPYFKISVFDFANSSVQLYLGILPLFFLVFAFMFKSALSRFFSFLFILCVLLGIKYSPLFWLLHQLPGFSSLRGPERWMFIGSFAGAVLTGFGIHYFLFQERDKWKKQLINVFKWLVWLITLVLVGMTSIFYFFKDKLVVFAQNYFVQNLYEKTSGLPLEHYYQYIDNLFLELEQAFYLFNPKVFLPLLFILISYFVIRYFCSKTVIILVILFNLFCINAFYHSTISAQEFYNQPTTVQFLKKELALIKPEQGQRIFSFLPGFSEYTQLTVPYQADARASFSFQKEIIVPNLNVFYGLSSVDIYDNLMSRRMSRILALIGSDRATIGDKLADLKITPEEKVKKLEERKKLLDLLGIRYIISIFPLNEEIFPRLFETNIPPYDIPLSIYENSTARPLFYLADKIEIIEPDEEKAYQKLLVDPLEEKNIFIECLTCPEQLDVDGQGEIIIEEKTNIFVQLRIKTKSNQWLVFSENYLPGWKAELDNKEITIYQVNTVYMGILVPTGQHQILFQYNPYSHL